MTAVEHVGDARRGVPDELLSGASPKTIAGYLFPEDRERFDVAYSAALEEARSSYELAGVHRVVERYRQLAGLQVDPEGFRDSVRSIAEAITGEPTPDGEPFEFTREKAGL